MRSQGTSSFRLLQGYIGEHEQSEEAKMWKVLIDFQELMSRASHLAAIQKWLKKVHCKLSSEVSKEKA